MDMDEDLRIILVQSGARRNYELAYIFEKAGVLADFHTTTASLEGQADWRIRALGPFGGKFSQLAKRRSLSQFPAEKLHPSFAADLARQVAENLFPERQRAKNWQNAVLGRQIRSRGFHNANVYFTVDGNGGFSAARAAKAAGLKIASDVVITPLYERIAGEEADRWPRWPAASFSLRQLAMVEEHYRQLIDVCDLLICPSQAVADGLAALDQSAAAKAVIVPYGLGGYSIEPGTPTPGRVLFAGSDALRKGLPYLGLAASQLKSTHPEIEVVIAGSFPSEIRAQPECADLTFTGHLSRDAMRAEFGRADVFCLPSLAEGMAGVCLEAMANGVPCIVTRAAGSPVEDGIGGVVVPERDSAAIAVAIVDITSDRAQRDTMSKAAMNLARSHSEERVAQQLFNVLHDLRAERSVSK